MEKPLAPELVPALLADEIRRVDPSGQRLARTFRESFDQAYYGQVTGHYSLEQLSKTERANIGSLVEINIRREFADVIGDGEDMDFDIAGYDVDCKYSMRPFGWMIPTEALGHFGMLCHADDEKGTWRVGFVYFTEEILNSGMNKDSKRTISASRRSAIHWLFLDETLPSNILLQLTPTDRNRVLEPESGQARLDMLFRIAQGVLIPRGTVATVAQQKDYMKRLRYNGGSRSNLQAEGIVILGDYRWHREVAKQLELPIPQDGDSLAVRLVPAKPTNSSPRVFLERTWWRVAEPSDPVVKAPIVATTRAMQEKHDQNIL